MDNRIMQALRLARHRYQFGGGPLGVNGTTPQDAMPDRGLGYNGPISYAKPDPTLPAPQPTQSPVPSTQMSLMSAAQPERAKGGIVDDALRLARNRYALGGSPSGAVTTQPAPGSNPALTNTANPAFQQSAPPVTEPVGSMAQFDMGQNPLTQSAPNPFDPNQAHLNNTAVGNQNDFVSQIQNAANNINKRIDTVDKGQTEALQNKSHDLQDQMKRYNSGQTTALNSATKELNSTIDKTAQDWNQQLATQGTNLSNIIDTNKKEGQQALQDQGTSLTNQMNSYNDAQTKALQTGLQDQNTNLTNAFTTGDTKLSNEIDANQKAQQDQYNKLQNGLQGKFQTINYELSQRAKLPYDDRNNPTTYEDWLNSTYTKNNLQPGEVLVQGPEADLLNPYGTQQAANGGRVERAHGGHISEDEIQELLDFPLGHYAEGGAVEEALEKTHGEHAISLHQAIARSGYAEGGHVSDAEIQELLDFPLGNYAEGGWIEE